MSAPAADPASLPGYLPVPGRTVPIRRDNHAARIALGLHQAGIPCSWTWLPIKKDKKVEKRKKGKKHLD